MPELQDTRGWWRMDAPQHLLFEQANIAAAHRERWPRDRHPADWRFPTPAARAGSVGHAAGASPQQQPTVETVLRGPAMGLWDAFPPAPKPKPKQRPPRTHVAARVPSATELIPGTSIKAQVAEMQRLMLRREIAALQREMAASQPVCGHAQPAAQLPAGTMPDPEPEPQAPPGLELEADTPTVQEGPAQAVQQAAPCDADLLKLIAGAPAELLRLREWQHSSKSVSAQVVAADSAEPMAQPSAADMRRTPPSAGIFSPGKGAVEIIDEAEVQFEPAAAPWPLSPSSQPKYKLAAEPGEALAAELEPVETPDEDTLHLAAPEEQSAGSDNTNDGAIATDFEATLRTAFEVAQSTSSTDPAPHSLDLRREAYARCLDPSQFPEVQASKLWQEDVAVLEAERDNELIVRLAACGVELRNDQLPGLKRQLLEDRGWFGGLSSGDGSKALYVQLLDGASLSTSPLSTADTGAGQAVLTALQRGGVYASDWSQPLLIRARTSAEFSIKLAYLACLLQDSYWAIGGHVTAITFGGRRYQRCGPYPGYAEQSFRYAANARAFELWHTSPTVAPPCMPLRPGLSTSVRPEPVDGPAVPTRRAFDELADGSVVLGLGLWVPWEVPAKLLWFVVPRSLPHTWGRQVAQLASLFDTLRDGICRASKKAMGPSLGLRTAFSVLVDRLALTTSVSELGELAKALASLIHLVRIAGANDAERQAGAAGSQGAVAEEKSWQHVAACERGGAAQPGGAWPPREASLRMPPVYDAVY